MIVIYIFSDLHFKIGNSMGQNENLGYILASKYRRKIIVSLLKGPKTPKQLSEETNLAIGNVSRTLTALRRRNFVECTTPSLKKGRIYRLTEKGEVIARMITK